MSEPEHVPPVPKVRQVGPAFAFFALAVVVGGYGVVVGVADENWIALVAGLVSCIGGAWILVLAARALLRVIRFNRLNRPS
jgi:hypothetical protein